MVVAKDEGQIPNGMMIQSVGCLANEGNAWKLTHGSMPTRARNPGDSPADALKAMASTPLGTETLQIPTMLPQRQTLAGHKVLAKGIFDVNPAGNRINLTALQSVADTCTS